MIYLHRLSLIVLLTFLSFSNTKANVDDIYAEIASAIKSGSSIEVAKYFSANVELTILDNEDLYSKAQAQLILKDFFEKYPPKAYKLIHQGSSTEGSKYAIGNYTTTNREFRTYFYIKQSGDKYFIQELRFEDEEE
ncbi:MAG: DUF4783 domain-containing protein [Bacteroidia bacterium]|nr:DUF4783 domain-containing protein [Bacteroidia bacterium]